MRGGFWRFNGSVDNFRDGELNGEFLYMSKALFFVACT